jgi:hypothetical protein
VDLHKEEVKFPSVGIINDLVQGSGRVQTIPHDPYSPPLMHDAATGKETEQQYDLKDI